jgi:hypothetical protein
VVRVAGPSMCTAEAPHAAPPSYNTHLGGGLGGGEGGGVVRTVGPSMCTAEAPHAAPPSSAPSPFTPTLYPTVL